MLIWTLPCQKVISLLLAATPTRFVSDPSAIVPVGQALEFGQRPGRHQEVLLARDGVRSRAGPAWPCGTSRSPPCACDPSTRETRTPVSSGRPSSWEAARTTWRTASPSAASDSCVVGSLGLAHRRELDDRIGPQLEGRAGRRDGDVVALVGEGHRARLEPAHDVGREPGRNHTTSVVDPDDLVGHLDRQVEVGPGARSACSRCTSAAGPSSTGEEPPRPPTARPAVASISTSASRSDLNFTDACPFGGVPMPFIVEGRVYGLVKVVRAVDCGRHGPIPAERGESLSPWRCGSGAGPATCGRGRPAPGDKRRAVPRAGRRRPQPLPPCKPQGHGR